MVELVGLVVHVVDGDGDQVLVAVVVAPVDGAGRESDDVALSDAVDLLVRLPRSLLLLPLLASERLLPAVGVERLRAPGESHTDESLTYTTSLSIYIILIIYYFHIPSHF